MGRHHATEPPAHEVRRLAPQHETRSPQARLHLVQHRLGLPPLTVQGRKLLGLPTGWIEDSGDPPVLRHGIRGRRVVGTRRHEPPCHIRASSLVHRVGADGAEVRPIRRAPQAWQPHVDPEPPARVLACRCALLPELVTGVVAVRKAQHACREAVCRLPCQGLPSSRGRPAGDRQQPRREVRQALRHGPQGPAVRQHAEGRQCRRRGLKHIRHLRYDRPDLAGCVATIGPLSIGYVQAGPYQAYHQLRLGYPIGPGQTRALRARKCPSLCHR
jgi:hypothetical protein